MARLAHCLKLSGPQEGRSPHTKSARLMKTRMSLRLQATKPVPMSASMLSETEPLACIASKECWCVPSVGCCQMICLRLHQTKTQGTKPGCRQVLYCLKQSHQPVFASKAGKDAITFSLAGHQTCDVSLFAVCNKWMHLCCLKQMSASMLSETKSSTCIASKGRNGCCQPVSLALQPTKCLPMSVSMLLDNVC